MKLQFLITFRSVTFAQRGQSVLTGAGIHCLLRRTPAELTAKGCGYCLRLQGKDALAAVELLRQHQIPFIRVYGQDGMGKMEERML